MNISNGVTVLVNISHMDPEVGPKRNKSVRLHTEGIKLYFTFKRLILGDPCQKKALQGSRHGPIWSIFLYSH